MVGHYSAGRERWKHCVRLVVAKPYHGGNSRNDHMSLELHRIVKARVVVVGAGDVVNSV